MRSTQELLTLSEAAVVAGVTVRDVNRVIDEKILPQQFYVADRGRRLYGVACPIVRFYFRTANELTAEERAWMIRHLCTTMKAGSWHSTDARWWRRLRKGDWKIHRDYLTVNLWSFVGETKDRHAMLEAARDMVVESPEVLGGTPTIKGTRVPVHDVAASVKAGYSNDRIRASYSSLDDRMIELATIYAEAFPLRGRPRRGVSPSGSVSERKIVRRRNV